MLYNTYNTNFWMASELIHSQMNLLKITEIIMCETLKLIYQIISGQINTDIALTTNADMHSCHTSQRYNAQVATKSNSLAQRRFTHQAVLHNNSLPQKIKQSVNITAFKKQARSF